MCDDRAVNCWICPVGVFCKIHQFDLDIQQCPLLEGLKKKGLRLGNW